MKRLKMIVISIMLGLTAQVSMADDYTYLFDPASLTVGQTLGEFLIVQDYCPKTNCTAAEKQKFVTAIDGRPGKLDIPVNAGNDFELSFNLQTPTSIMCNSNSNLAITLYLSDNSLLPIIFSGCSFPLGTSNYDYSSNWIANSVNDFRLISEQGNLTISVNGILTKAKASLTGTINRIMLSKIRAGQEKLFEIKTRGIQKAGSTSCPTTPTTTTPTTSDCTAKYTSDGKVSVPCIEVPVGFTTQIYQIEMRQRTGSFIFDLDMNSVKPR